MEGETRIAAAISHQPGRVMERAEIVELFERRQQAYDNLDAAALAADYADNAQVDSPSAGTHVGRKAAEATLRAIFTAFLDLKVTTESLLIDGSQVAQLLSIEGTNIGGLFGLPPSGKHFSIPGIFLYEVEDGKIIRERRIYDFTGLLVQVGVLKAKPA